MDVVFKLVLSVCQSVSLSIPSLVTQSYLHLCHNIYSEDSSFDLMMTRADQKSILRSASGKTWFQILINGSHAASPYLPGVSDGSPESDLNLFPSHYVMRRWIWQGVQGPSSIPSWAYINQRPDHKRDYCWCYLGAIRLRLSKQQQ